MNPLSTRTLAFAGATLAVAAMIYTPMWDLVMSGTRSDYYSHIPLIPLVSVYLLATERKEIFAGPVYALRSGIPVAAAGMVVYGLAWALESRLTQNDFASLAVLGALTLWVGAFILLFGGASFRAALFPLLFLIFMIPIPWKIMDGIIYALQVASTEVVNVLFAMTGIPYTRQGQFIFHLPGVGIEVAKQCSGIRSSLALFVTSIVGGHLFLRRFPHKAILAVAVFPITVIKNGIRILTLTLLAYFVDERFLTGGFLHTSGGFLFYIPALILMGGIVWWFRKREKAQKAE